MCAWYILNASTALKDDAVLRVTLISAVLFVLNAPSGSLEPVPSMVRSSLSLLMIWPPTAAVTSDGSSPVKSSPSNSSPNCVTAAYLYMVSKRWPKVGSRTGLVLPSPTIVTLAILPAMGRLSVVVPSSCTKYGMRSERPGTE